MKKFRFLLSIIVVSHLSALYGCSATPDQLAWRFQQGQSYSVKVKLVSNLIILVPNADYKESEMVLNCRVKEIDPSQRATIEATIVSVRASMKSLHISYSYDSQKAQDSDQPKEGKKKKQQQAFINAFAGLTGQKFSVQIDPRKQSVKLLDMDEPIEKAAFAGTKGNMFGGDQVNMLLAEKNLCEYITGGLLAAPVAIKAKPKETWTRDSSILAPYTPIVPTRLTYTVESIKEQQDDQLAVVSYKITGNDSPRPTPHDSQKTTRTKPKKKTSFNVMSVDGSGELIFSMEKGQLIKLSEKTTVNISSKQRSPAVKQGTSSRRKKSKIFYVIEKNIEYDN